MSSAIWTYTDPNDPDKKPLFLMTTTLDPHYRVLFNPAQAESTKKQLLKQLKDAAGKNGHTGSPVSVASETQSPEGTDKLRLYEQWNDSVICQNYLKKRLKKALRKFPKHHLASETWNITYKHSSSYWRGRSVTILDRLRQDLPSVVVNCPRSANNPLVINSSWARLLCCGWINKWKAEQTCRPKSQASNNSS